MPPTKRHLDAGMRNSEIEPGFCATSGAELRVYIRTNLRQTIALRADYLYSARDNPTTGSDRPVLPLTFDHFYLFLFI